MLLNLGNKFKFFLKKSYVKLSDLIFRDRQKIEKTLLDLIDSACKHFSYIFFKVTCGVFLVI